MSSLYKHLASRFPAVQSEKESRIPAISGAEQGENSTHENKNEVKKHDLTSMDGTDKQSVFENHQRNGNSEQNEKVSQVSLARAKKKRLPTPSLKVNISSNLHKFPSSDNRDTIGSNTSISPGDCTNCPASAGWAWKGSGKWCFYSAYFLGKTAKPVRCEISKKNCPLHNQEN